ncbi:protein adenylyltransferase SelO [Salinisphaera sp.]|uniref:protein adenylyltransferase SelO n=1 Tax=Salinisphaera sp. TaxID=1914330 RepID=UPI000C3FA585|nr:YdiU family protein [Salinisphaera sp.]MBS62092.1 hypothetical protein [Salinisphaera sp.]
MTETAAAEPFVLDNSYARLPGEFHARAMPTAVAAARLLRVNRPLAEQLGLDVQALESPAGVDILAGNRVPKGAEPLAMAYAGHQFGNFSPVLGDGRAVLLGEMTDRNGVRRDIQLKGAGPTPFSSRGDGRAALGPVIREYVVSEGMAALGIPTTRALAMVATGESVRRRRAEPGGVLTRVAASHVRVGTFEYFYRQGHNEAVRALADYVIERHYPHVADADNPYHALLEEVAAHTADLIAQWLLVGFIHGVMNTDNVSIAGETIDYGPCAFMDSYNPATVYSSIDHGGRYAYNRQPGIGQWNLARFAECLLPLLDEDQEKAVEQAQAVLERYVERFETTYHDGLAAKIGLEERREGDADLAYDLLKRMTEQGADFTLTFRHLSDLGRAADDRDDNVRALFDDPSGFDGWAVRWRERLADETRDDAERRAAMRAVNPAYIPRNHRIQQAIDAAEAGDYQPLDDLLTVVANPYDDHPELAEYARPPKPEEVVERTFCGT